MRDAVALLFTAVVALSCLEAVQTLRRRGALSVEASRKLIHLSMGVVFLLCWHAFSDGPSARLWAAAVPAAITAKFALVGLGALRDDETVRSISRTGRREELLAGPLYYGVVLTASTAALWGDSPAGVVAVALLCVGDAAAAVVGRAFPAGPRLPHNADKSWAGTAAFCASSFAAGYALVALFHATGWFPDTAAGYAPALAFTVAVAAAAESLPLAEVDNLTVFGAALAAAWLYPSLVPGGGGTPYST